VPGENAVVAQFVLFGGPGFLVSLVLGLLLGRHRRALVVATVIVLALLSVLVGRALTDDDPAESQVPLTILLAGANGLGWIVGAALGATIRRHRASPRRPRAA
jgi:Cu/Ag efflux pump CusA